jgi:hypothetical protein
LQFIVSNRPSKIQAWLVIRNSWQFNGFIFNSIVMDEKYASIYGFPSFTQLLNSRHVTSKDMSS